MSERELRLDPLPSDGAEWRCAAGLETRIVNLRVRIERVECRKPAVGLMPAEVAEQFHVMRATCQEHADFISDEIPDDGPLAKYLTD